MKSSLIFCGLGFLCIVIGGHCDTIAFQPGQTYSWVIPPENRRPSSRPSQYQDETAANFDQRNESPVAPIGGYGHPPFYLRRSHEQLNLPNEFLISSNHDGGLSPMPIFRKLDPVDCDGDPTCPNVDITQRQQSPTTIHQSNIASVPTIATPDYQQQPSNNPPVSPGQSISWPSSHGGGIGLLFFVTDSASHLPVEQLIRQHLALHPTSQFPFDISINCEDAAGSNFQPAGGSLPLPLPQPTTTVNERNVENRNYASLPSDEIDSRSGNIRRGSQQQQQQQQQQQRRKWRNISERLVQNRQQQLYHLQQQQRQQLQHNQQELSIST